MTSSKKCEANKCWNSIKEFFSHTLTILTIILLISISCIYLIIYHHIKDTDSEFFKTLSQGEVLAGILVFIPTTFTWLINSLRSNKEKARMEMREEYLKWLDDFTYKNDTINSNIMLRIKLEQLLKENEIYNFIKYDSLFATIQKNLTISNANNNLNEWMNINHKLIESIDDKTIKNIIIENSTNTFKAISFDGSYIEKISSWTEENNPFIFKNCKLTKNFISNLSEIESSSHFTFEECIIDISPSEFSEKFKDKTTVMPVYYRRIGDIKCKYYEENDNEDEKENKVLQQEDSNEAKDQYIYYDMRNFDENFPINEYLYNHNSIDIELDSNKNINTKIIEKLKNIFNEENSESDISKVLNLENPKYIISKSKSYIPTNQNENDFKMHSWNVLKGNQVNKNIEYIIFAIQTEQNEENKFRKFTCLIFTKEKFNELYSELYDFKEEFSDERYYFYYATKNS